MNVVDKCPPPKLPLLREFQDWVLRESPDRSKNTNTVPGSEVPSASEDSAAVLESTTLVVREARQGDLTTLQVSPAVGTYTGSLTPYCTL